MNKENSLKSNIFILLGLGALCLFLNFTNFDFPVSYHYDEIKKVRFLKDAGYDFHHPILMIQTAGILKNMIPVSGDEQLILLGRAVSVLSGLVIVLATFYMARMKFDRLFSFFAAATLAVTPIIVSHAHYFKEDMIFTACTMLSLLCFFRYLRVQNVPAALLLGLFLGLSFSAQYKGVLTIALILMAPAYLSQCRNMRYVKHCLIYLLVILIVFVAVNYPMFLHLDTFVNGISSESDHVLTGHTLKIYPLPHFFSYHLMNSIRPGITLPLTVLALAGLLMGLFSWKREAIHNKILFLYCMAFYFAHELSPSKPAPDFPRYMIPIVPVLIYFAFNALNAIFHWIQKNVTGKTLSRAICTVIIIIVLAPPLYNSAMIKYHLNNDTRKQAADWIDKEGEKALFERHALNDYDQDEFLISKINIEDAKREGVAYLVASSLAYERYFRGVNLDGQSARVHNRYKMYNDLFSYPFIEIKPKFKTVAFSNPTIRIVDIRSTK